MKRIFSIIPVLFLANSLFAQFVQLDINQSVRREIDRKFGRDGLLSASQTIKSEKREILISVKAIKKMDLIICFFYGFGDGQTNKEFFLGEVSNTDKFEKSFSLPVISQVISESIYYNTGFYRSRDTNRFKCPKTMACFFVYEKITGKFLGSKSTNFKFGKDIKKQFKSEIEAFVNSHKG